MRAVTTRPMNADLVTMAAVSGPVAGKKRSAQYHTAIAESTPVTARPLYNAAMIFFSFVSLMKKMPTMDATIEMPPNASGKSTTFGLTGYARLPMDHGRD